MMEALTMQQASRLHLGAAYYPEHWPEDHWPEDIRLMREAGLTVARMAEFSWSTLEPTAGKFDFGWLERAISMLADAGIVSVLGTPTAAPPAWLVQQHPDMMAVDENGRRVQFGNRCHYCVNSPEFHAATRRIVGAMAGHFGDSPQVIGWQIDNEYNRTCHCDRCRSRFQRYLADKFGSLDALNRHWSTAYWSQTYSAWEQIPIPIGPHNPGLMLEFKRFVTESYRQFQRLQLDALQPHLQAGVWVTHNFMGWFDGFDHYELAKDLDLASWDWYVPTGHHDYLTSGAIHDLTRGFKRRSFWLMETQPGNVNWASINTTLVKGEARAMAWHAVAHGADAVLYWQWRAALNGQEQYHGTLVDQSGQPRPFYEEVQWLGCDLKTASDLVAGSMVVSRVALLNSYDSRWAVQWQRHHRDLDFVAHLKHYYRPLAARNIATDVISANTPLDGYRLVAAPALVMVSESQAKQLRDFVKRGGHLVLTVRCGMKDEFNALLPSRQPGPLVDLAGVEVEEYYALLDPVPVVGNWFTGASQFWAERLKVLDTDNTHVVARFSASNGWLDDQLAITVHSYGRGLVYYVGVYLDEDAQQALMDHIVSMAGVRAVLDTPDGVEARLRVAPDGKRIYILVNHKREEQSVTLPWSAHEHLDGRSVEDELKLAPYGVAILTRLEERAR
jgi:beta-galactosidase